MFLARFHVLTDFKRRRRKNQNKRKIIKMNKLVALETICLGRGFKYSPTLLRLPTSSIQSQDRQQRRQFTQSFWNDVSSSAPVTFMQESITTLHDLSGLSWWSTIIVSTVLLRGCITFPLSLYQSKILAKVERLTEEMPEIVRGLKVETNFAVKKFHWTENQARMMYNRSLKQQWNNLIIRDNCHPAKAAVVILFQIPLWITQSWGIRNLIYMQPDPTSIQAQLIASEMMFGGFAWIPNLTEVDHSWILPVSLGLLNLSIIEVEKITKILKTKAHRFSILDSENEQESSGQQQAVDLRNELFPRLQHLHDSNCCLCSVRALSLLGVVKRLWTRSKSRSVVSKTETARKNTESQQ